MLLTKLKSLYPLRKYFAAAFLVTLILGPALYFRLYPVHLFPKVRAENTAKMTVHTNLRALLQRNIQKNSSTLNQREQASMLDMLYKKTLREDRTNLNKVIADNTERLLKISKEEHSDSFLLGADPYYYMGLTAKLAAGINPYSRMDGRNYFNGNMLAPTGHWYPMDFHPHVGSMIHNAIRLFNGNIPLHNSIRWTPLILSLLCLIPFFWITHRGLNLPLAICALGAANLLIAPIFLKRSLVGWYDTDPYIILFLLTGTASAVSLLNSLKEASKIKFVSAACYGLSFGAFALFWRGWFIPWVLMTAVLNTVLFIFCLKKRRYALFKIMSLIWLLPVALIALVWGIKGLGQEFTYGFDFIAGFFDSGISIWPDVMVTVGELKSGSFSKIASLLGGIPVLTLSLLPVILYRFVMKEIKVELPVFIFLCVLFSISFFAALKIERLALQAVPFTSVLFTLSVPVTAHIASLISKATFIDSFKARNTAIPLFLTLMILGGSLLYTGKRAHATIVNFHPIFNTYWNKVLTDIKMNTPADSIVTTWWSPGHFISSVTGRRVTIDGATQENTRAYWVARLFTSTTEPEALGILRMLNTSGDKALHRLLDAGFPIDQAVEAVRRIIPYPKSKAMTLLSKYAGADLAAEVVNLTHGTADELPPSYLFTYAHMMRQAMALEYVGGWNFAKAAKMSALFDQGGRSRKAVLKALDIPGPKSKRLWAFSQKPSVQNSVAAEKKRQGNWIFFADGLSFNTKTFDSKLNNEKFGKGVPKLIHFVDSNGEYRRIETGGKLETAAVLIRDLSGETVRYRSLLMTPKLSDTMLVRLFYLEAKGLRFIRQVNLVDAPGMAERFTVNEVDWDAYDRFMQLLG